MLAALRAMLLLPVAGFGAEPNHSWDTLIGTVTTGKKVIVTLMNPMNVQGKLLAVDTNSITVEQPYGPQVIKVADVFRVRYTGGRKHHVLYGILIGMASGALTLAVIDKQSSHPETVDAAVMGAIFFGLPAGAIGGAVIPIGPPLYEAVHVIRKTP